MTRFQNIHESIGIGTILHNPLSAQQTEQIAQYQLAQLANNEDVCFVTQNSSTCPTIHNFYGPSYSNEPQGLDLLVVQLNQKIVMPMPKFFQTPIQEALLTQCVTICTNLKKASQTCSGSSSLVSHSPRKFRNLTYLLWPSSLCTQHEVNQSSQCI